MLFHREFHNILHQDYLDSNSPQRNAPMDNLRRRDYQDHRPNTTVNHLDMDNHLDLDYNQNNLNHWWGSHKDYLGSNS